MIYLSEEEIQSLLNWDDTFEAIKVAMMAVSSGKTQVGQRVFTDVFNTGKWMLTMSGFLEDEKYGGWACKIVRLNPENVKGTNPMPAMNVTVLLLDDDTGALKAVFAGVEITNQRTAAASAVATKYLHTEKPQKVLSVFGCGLQGKAHAECFYHLFQFDEIRLWNRTSSRAINLAKELNEKLGTTKFKAVGDRQCCTRGADVIVTATCPDSTPLINYAWLNEGVHINAVGVVGSTTTDEKHFELDEKTYKNANVYVDSWGGAEVELKKLKDCGINMTAEIGEVILGKVPKPEREKLTVFQSLGMAAEDCAMARMIYDLHLQKAQ